MDTPATTPIAPAVESPTPNPVAAQVSTVVAVQPDACAPTIDPAIPTEDPEGLAELTPVAAGPVDLPSSNSASSAPPLSSEPEHQLESPTDPAAGVAPGPAVSSALTAYPTSRLPAPLLLLFEYWHARRTSRRLVALHRRVHAEQPEKAGRALYEEVVVRWAGLERPAARTILARAARVLSTGTPTRICAFATSCCTSSRTSTCWLDRSDAVSWRT